MAVPSSIKQKGVNIDGSVWFRSTVDVPADWDFAHPSMLALSFVQHNSVAYVNGIEIGRKQNDGREWVGHNYPFSSKMLHAGKNTIAVRITVEIGHGGFYPPYPRPLTLFRLMDGRVIQASSQTFRLKKAVSSGSPPPRAISTRNGGRTWSSHASRRNVC